MENRESPRIEISNCRLNMKNFLFHRIYKSNLTFCHSQYNCTKDYGSKHSSPDYKLLNSQHLPHFLTLYPSSLPYSTDLRCLPNLI